MNLYKVSYSLSYSFLVDATTYASDNLLWFRPNLLEKRLELKNYNTILTDKQQKYLLNQQVKLINQKSYSWGNITSWSK